MEALAVHFEATAEAEFAPRYNLAPTTRVPVVKATAAGRTLVLHHWGLIPSWAKDPALAGRLANARAETVAEKPSFRGPFRSRRCLVPADGFFEWQSLPGAAKQPFLFRATQGGLLAIAGLWDRWEGPESAVLSCTLITTTASGDLAGIHDRMPVLLAPADFAAWLDPGNRDRDGLQALLRPAAEGLLCRVPVSPRVNKVSNDDPELLEPWDV